MYTIGKFAEICDVPVKTIRYYSDIGLIQPSYTDPITNYRYYDYDKIKKMERIKILKECNFSLKDIKAYVEKEIDKLEWQHLLKHKIAELQEQKEQIDTQIQQIQRWKEQGIEEGSLLSGATLSDIYTEQRKVVTVYSIREKKDVMLMDDLVQMLFDRVFAFNLKVDGKLMSIFHEKGTSPKQSDIEVLIPVQKDQQIEGCKTVAGGTYACITVKGPYSELVHGYHALQRWMKENDVMEAGHALEIYEEGLIPAEYHPRDIKPDLDLHPSAFVTKICIPIMKK
ncbi:MerR family transcriptional regulator [Longirhabdus pacifica]|uniref:MerR family transcriptional regulator n=1 Tax=Longirhabdus pacifica TaxID=2305227 RepID=UPI0010092A6D|nr:MerR family transcriptional regulator [Longirhabdus pacifica]